MRPPTHSKVRRAVRPKLVELARATRPFLEPMLAAGMTWQEIGQAIERHFATSDETSSATRDDSAPSGS